MSKHDVSALRPLARLAVGRSGADIERIVREARRAARREVRSLRWDDIADALGAARRGRPEALRWRMAVHEAGHALAHLVIGHENGSGHGSLTIMSIEADHGGMVHVQPDPHVPETEAHLMGLITVRLAGRVAEEIVFGDPVAGSGGTPDSDLAQATDIAVMLESALGFGRHQPLLYRHMGDRSHMLALDQRLAACVHARLEASHDQAQAILAAEQETHLWLARTLLRYGVLEGDELAEVVKEARRRLGTSASQSAGTDAGNASR
jgi:ATP-dependent Zn protease